MDFKGPRELHQQSPDFDDLKVKTEMCAGLCLQYFVLSGVTTEKVLLFEGCINKETTGQHSDDTLIKLNPLLLLICLG